MSGNNFVHNNIKISTNRIKKMWHSWPATGYLFPPLQETESRNKTSQARICTKTQLFNFININVFFFFINSFFLNSSSLSTNRKQTVCTTDRTPTALSIHKVKMNIFVFRQRFQVPPPSLPSTAIISVTTTFRPRIGCSPFAVACVGIRCVLERCDGRRWVRSRPFLMGGVGGCAVFSSFRRTTSCRSYYGSTVDTTVFPLIHTLGQQALQCL